MSKEKILVIEDDRDIQELVVFNLEKESESAEISVEKVKLNGVKPSIVIAPSKKGAINIDKNLLLNKVVKLKSLF